MDGWVKTYIGPRRPLFMFWVKPKVNVKLHNVLKLTHNLFLNLTNWFWCLKPIKLWKFDNVNHKMTKVCLQLTSLSLVLSNGQIEQSLWESLEIDLFNQLGMKMCRLDHCWTTGQVWLCSHSRWLTPQMCKAKPQFTTNGDKEQNKERKGKTWCHENWKSKCSF